MDYLELSKMSKFEQETYLTRREDELCAKYGEAVAPSEDWSQSDQKVLHETFDELTTQAADTASQYVAPAVNALRVAAEVALSILPAAPVVMFAEAVFIRVHEKNPRTAQRLLRDIKAIPLRTWKELAPEATGLDIFPHGLAELRDTIVGALETRQKSLPIRDVLDSQYLWARSSEEEQRS